MAAGRATGTSGGGSGGGGAGKVCVACGEDVSSKPRTKDAKGRYYCTPCYQHALEHKQARRESTPLPKADAPRSAASMPNSLLSDEPIGMDDAPLGGGVTGGMLDQLIDLEPSTVAPPLMCPSCRSSIPAGGTLCTLCGYNLHTGAAIATTAIHKAPRAGGAAWPIVIGSVSVSFGGLGAILYAISAVMAFTGSSGGAAAEASTTRMIGRVGGSILVFSLAVWLLVGGIGILRRDSNAVSSLRRWAITKLAFVGVCMLPTSILAAVAFEGASASGRMPQELGALGNALVAYLLLLTAWMAFWPIFLLMWFGRAAIKNDVERWD